MTLVTYFEYVELLNIVEQFSVFWTDGVIAKEVKSEVITSGLHDQYIYKYLSLLRILYTITLLSSEFAFVMGHNYYKCFQTQKAMVSAVK